MLAKKKFAKPFVNSLNVCFVASMLFYGTASEAQSGDNTISVVNYNVSGHLAVSHDKADYEKVFKALKGDGDIDFVGTVEMLGNINDSFIAGLQNASAKDGEVGDEFKEIGRARGGLKYQSPDEMTAIYYNAKRWTLTKYSTIAENPVLKDDCNNYSLDIVYPAPNKEASGQPCKMAKADGVFNGEMYTFPINYVNDANPKNFFPGDEKKDPNSGVTYGPWNRIATFGVFTNNQDSKKVIVVMTHFPKGAKENVRQKETAFKNLYKYVIEKLAANESNPRVIFMGDLNYKPLREGGGDQEYFDLLKYITTSDSFPLFKGSEPKGETNEVLWTIGSSNLSPISYEKLSEEDQIQKTGAAKLTTDHIITKTVFQN